MGKYIAKRILWLIPVIMGVTFLIFTIMFFIPGDPVAIMLGSSATPAEIEQAREMLGLNGSYLHRFWNYASGVFLRFDLGTSFQYGTSVTADMLTRFPRTFTRCGQYADLHLCGGAAWGNRGNPPEYGFRPCLHDCCHVWRIHAFLLAGDSAGTFIFHEAGAASLLWNRRAKILYPSGYRQLLWRNRRIRQTDAVQCAGVYPGGLCDNSEG